MPLLDTLSSGGTFLFCSNPAMVRCGIASCACGLGGDISAEEADLMQRALDENAVIVAQVTPSFEA